MFIEQPTATCTVVQAGVNATPGQQVGVPAASQLSHQGLLVSVNTG